MSIPPTGPVQTPDLAALLDATVAQAFADFNCHLLGTVVSFDVATQRVQAKVNFVRVVGESTVEYPLLVDVPTFVLSGGPASVRLPIAAGDTCLVLFHDRDFDGWAETGTVAIPNSTRLHSLADGLALVGFRSKANALAAYSAADAEIVHGTSKIALRADGTLAVTVAGGLTITTTAGGKVAIANGSSSLTSALDDLCTALLGWVNTINASTPNPATVAAITAAKAKIDNVLG